MDFTFGIITNGLNTDNIKLMILSIEKLNIPNYEIIIIGGENVYNNNNLIHHTFDETIRTAWITKKKNIIANLARYENIVMCHDYISFCDDWYKGFLQFGNNFNICVNKILDKDSSRFRDYTLFPYGMKQYCTNTLLPYSFESNQKISKIMYISGSYYVVKKNIALQFPLDERLVWVQSEDVLFSKQLTLNNIILECNKYSTVQLLKFKGLGPNDLEVTNDELTKLNNLSDEELNNVIKEQIIELRRYVFEKAGFDVLTCL